MSTCGCGRPVLRVDVSGEFVTVDREQHSSGRIEVRTWGDLLYGKRIGHSKPPEPGCTRHRRHQCERGTNA